MFLLELSACASGNGISPVLDAPNLDRFNAGQSIADAVRQSKDEPVNRGEWWKIYGDPQLDRLIDLGLKEAPSITAAAARIMRSVGVLNGAKAEELPSLTGSGQIMGERFPDHYLYPQPYAGSGGSEGSLLAVARYHLDFWGKRRETIAAAGERLNAARAEADDVALLLQTILVETYFRLDAAYKIRDIAVSGLSRRQGIIDLLTIRAKAGLATEIDAAQAKETITETRSEIARLDGEVARRRYQIAALIGKDPAFAEKIKRPILTASADPTPLSAIPATLLGYRPDVAIQRALVEAAAHDMGAAKAAFYPDVDLTAFAGFKSVDLGFLLHPGSAATGIGPAITLPIFDGGRLRSNLKGRAAEYDVAVSTYNATIAAALGQVAEGIVTLKSEQTRKAEADATVAHWNRIVGLQKLRKQHELSSASECLTAEIALLLSERRATEVSTQVAVAQVSLIRALGGAWTPFSSLSTGRTAAGTTITQRGNLLHE